MEVPVERYGEVEGDTAGVEVQEMDDLQHEIGARLVKDCICGQEGGAG